MLHFLITLLHKRKGHDISGHDLIRALRDSGYQPDLRFRKTGGNAVKINSNAKMKVGY